MDRRHEAARRITQHDSKLEPSAPTAAAAGPRDKSSQAIVTGVSAMAEAAAWNTGGDHG